MSLYVFMSIFPKQMEKVLEPQQLNTTSPLCDIWVVNLQDNGVIHPIVMHHNGNVIATTAAPAAICSLEKQKMEKYFHKFSCSDGRTAAT